MREKVICSKTILTSFREAPPITPPEHKKEDVYENNMNVFETVDETAKEVTFVKSHGRQKQECLLQAAKTEYHTFSSLVRVLVKYCTSELDKARAIFRLVFSSRARQANYKPRTHLLLH